MRVAFVVQRYGEEVAGGSEALCRNVAEKLSKYYEIEVLTTCAKDYITWKNEFPVGEEIINNVLVRRFPVDRERDLSEFTKKTQKIFYESHTGGDELDWIRDQGPYSSNLLNYINDHNGDYNLFVFYTYRYYPSFFGLPLVSKKSILVPTAEYEPTLNLDVYKSLFDSARVVVYLTEEEKSIINTKFANQDCVSDIIGMGISVPEILDDNNFKIKYHIHGDFIIYVGRIDVNKGCNELFDFFLKYKTYTKSNLKLVLIGRPVMQIPNHPDILHLGFLSEEDKFKGIKTAKILIMPSEYESYSIVITESWFLKTPVLVNGKCNVLVGQCNRSNGGLNYENYEEFKACLYILMNDEQLRKNLGENGYDYVTMYYNWPKIESQYRTLFDMILNDQSRN